MKKLYYLIMVLFVFFFVGCGSKELTTYDEINYQEYVNLMENDETFSLVIGSSTCSACALYKSTMERFINKYQINVRYIDLTKLSEEEYNLLRTEINFSSTPTTIFVEKGNHTSVYDRLVGSANFSNVVSAYTKKGYIK